MAWFFELQTEHTILGVQIKAFLHHERTPYQDIKVYDTVEYGRMLVLDDIIQLTELDEFVYHEMLAHVPLHLHPNPEIVLIVGGGDGGTVREVSKHDTVKKVILAEIDERVVSTAREFLPFVSLALKDNPKLELRIGDAVKTVAEAREAFDLVIVDSSDPVGPGEALFSHDFYQSIYKALKPGGMLVIQGESPWLHRPLVKRVNGDLKRIYESAAIYWGNIPTYPSGTMVFPFACKGELPAKLCKPVLPELRYYSLEVHQAAFMLPWFLRPENM
jgi:spermidine synthase